MDKLEALGLAILVTLIVLIVILLIAVSSPATVLGSQKL